MSQHPHAGHSHGLSAAAVAPGNARRLGAALAMILAFMAAEVVTGIAAHSLALLSDAAHMLTDAAALILALVAARLSARPPKGGLTFGLRRTEILSGLVNATMLLVLAGLVVYEAIRRLLSPGPVNAGLVAGVAVAGIGVNLLATWQLAKANRTSLNIRASYAHILTDLYAFIATGVAAAVILVTGFRRADALASLLVAALMVHASIHLLREAVRVLLEAAPEGMDPREIGEGLEAHPCVTNVHDLHVWEITSGFPALAAHILVRPGDDCHAVREDLEGLLKDRFGIDHTTLQVDHDQRGRLLRIEERPPVEPEVPDST
jgi:cobalt-zinc-cadmium efflux system protein